MRHPIPRSPLLAILVVVGLGLSFVHRVGAEAPPPKSATSKPAAPKASPTPAQSRFNTNIYEAQDDRVQFTDTVKLVRELDGNTEILFVKRGGVFQAPSDSSALARLIESQRSKSAVTVSVDDHSQKIMSVLSAPRAKTGGQ